MRKQILAAALLLVTASTLVWAQTISHGIGLSWTYANTAASFNVYRATTSGGETQPPYAAGVVYATAPCVEGNTSLPAPCWQDPAPVVGTKYFYTVTAVVGGVESGPSSEVSAQIAVPSSPTNPQSAAH